MLNDRWEQGSEFHQLDYPASVDAGSWLQSKSYWGSGRDALCVLLHYGQQARGWRRLWIPAYFCQKVVTALLSTGLPIGVFSASPSDPEQLPQDLRAGDVLLRVNYFGLQSFQSAAPLQSAGIEVIEDHTHDPWSDWSTRSDAAWCVASLRKVLPVPDGGVLWSPQAHALPSASPPTDRHRIASSEKMIAMLLKSLYLDGALLNKDVYRRLALSGEQQMGQGEVSGITEWSAALLSTFPWQEWRGRRRANHDVLCHLLEEVPRVVVLGASHEEGTCPFSVLLVLDTPATRDTLRRALIAASVYPAVLWSLENPVVQDIPPRHIALSRRVLSIHCDARYNEQDMVRVASLIRSSLAA